MPQVEPSLPDGTPQASGQVPKWTSAIVGQYDDGTPTVALIDERGRERLLGTPAEIESLLNPAHAAVTGGAR